MAAVPILGTKFAFGVLLGTCRRHRISLAPWLILCPRCCYYLLGIQKGADGRVSVRHNSQKKEKLHEEKGYCNLKEVLKRFQEFQFTNSFANSYNLFNAMMIRFLKDTNLVVRKKKSF